MYPVRPDSFLPRRHPRSCSPEDGLPRFFFRDYGDSTEPMLGPESIRGKRRTPGTVGEINGVGASRLTVRCSGWVGVLFTEVRPGYVRGLADPPLQAGRKFTGASGEDEDPADEA